MSFISAPATFFGAGYALSSSEVKFTTSTNAGTTLGTFTVVAATDVITVSAAHNLKVGDTVQVSSGTTLPAGLAASTNYYVKTVPSSTTLTLSATPSGDTLDITDTGTGTHSIAAPGLLREVTDTEANASSGDWRKLVFGLMEMLYNRWSATATADRPAKLTIQRNSYEDATTSEMVRTYTITARTQVSAQEVANE